MKMGASYINIPPTCVQYQNLKIMYSYEDFKEMLGVPTINFYQGKGREFAKIGEYQIFAAERLDWNKPLFVIQGEHDAWWVCNSKAKLVRTV